MLQPLQVCAEPPLGIVEASVGLISLVCSDFQCLLLDWSVEDKLQSLGGAYVLSQCMH